MLRRYNGAAAAATILFSCASGHAADQHTTTQSNVDTITVTGSPLSTDADKLATIVGQVSREDILLSGGSNLADTLSSVPGVTGTSFASGASRPVIRGFDANRVRILENGVGSFDVSDVGPDHGVPIDPLATQKIEVVRGAATLRYGSQAIGGVVNAINNRVPMTLPDKIITGEAEGSYGINGNVGEGSALTDVRAGQFALHADGFIRRTQDYDTPLGKMPNSFFRGDGVSAGGSYFFGTDNTSRLGAAVVHYDSQYGIPAGDTFIDMKQTKGIFQSSFAVNTGPLHIITVDGGYADYKHDEVDPNGNVVLSTFKDKEWDSRAEALFDAMGPLSSSALGVQVTQKDFSALGEGFNYLQPATTKSFAGFGFTEAPLLKNLKLQLGARVEHVAIDGTPASGVATALSYTPVSGSAGFVFEASQVLTLGLTFSSAARAPGQTELFARGPHDGPGTFETGDPTLKIERANSVEGTVRVRAQGFDFEGAAWGAKFKNFIYGQITGRTCDEDGVCVAGDSEELKELNYTQRGATFWGLEGKATVSLATIGEGSLGANFIADYVRAKLDSPAGNVPRIPPYHAGGGLFWESDSIYANFMLRYTGTQNEVGFAETPTRGFANLDAQVTWKPSLQYPHIELAVVGKNLTDRVQRNAISINKDDVILQGRDVRFVLRTTF